jgi:hypothetical protein
MWRVERLSTHQTADNPARNIILDEFVNLCPDSLGQASGAALIVFHDLNRMIVTPKFWRLD